MATFGINVPVGAPATTIDQAVRAADDMKDENNEVFPSQRKESFM
jgi:hypothetical protein